MMYLSIYCNIFRMVVLVRVWIPQMCRMSFQPRLPSARVLLHRQGSILALLQLGFKSFLRFVSSLADSGLNVVSTGSVWNVMHANISVSRWTSILVKIMFHAAQIMIELIFWGTVGTGRFATGGNAAKLTLLCRAKKVWRLISSGRQSVTQWG